jgi:hypothetical protein
LENTKRELQGRHLLNFCVLLENMRPLVLVQKHEKESSSKSMHEKESSSKSMKKDL